MATAVLFASLDGKDRKYIDFSPVPAAKLYPGTRSNTYFYNLHLFSKEKSLVVLLVRIFLLFAFDRLTRAVVTTVVIHGDMCLGYRLISRILQCNVKTPGVKS